MRPRTSALSGSRRGKTPAGRNCRTNLSRMTPPLLSDRIAFLPKAELHLHLEGSIQPATVCALTARHGVAMAEEEVRQRYAYRDFPEFIEAFKWVTSFLREPQDYALIASGLAEHLLAQRVVYTEVTLSIGVMLLRKQQPERNFEGDRGFRHRRRRAQRSHRRISSRVRPRRATGPAPVNARRRGRRPGKNSRSHRITRCGTYRSRNRRNQRSRIDGFARGAKNPT